jgi:hypothetical protein
MKSRKERSRSISTLSDGVEDEVDCELGGSRKKPRTSRRSSNSAVIDILREDSQKSNDTMKLFITNAERDRLDQRERWDRDHEMQERELALRQRQMDLQFAEMEERKKDRELERELMREHLRKK